MTGLSNSVKHSHLGVSRVTGDWKGKLNQPQSQAPKLVKQVLSTIIIRFYISPLKNLDLILLFDKLQRWLILSIGLRVYHCYNITQ